MKKNNNNNKKNVQWEAQFVKNNNNNNNKKEQLAGQMRNPVFVRNNGNYFSASFRQLGIRCEFTKQAKNCARLYLLDKPVRFLYFVFSLLLF